MNLNDEIAVESDAGGKPSVVDRESWERALIGREFRHFKGNRYRLEGFARDSESLEEMVVYRALYGEGGLWVSPARMFFETVERDGKRMKRFEPVEEA